MSYRITFNRRQFGIHEYGNRRGTPVFYFHGFPGSRLDGVSLNFNAQAKSAGFRVIAVDRPGVGLSTFRNDRTILNTTTDIARIADMLSIDAFSVAGFSGGGPYALATAFKYPNRVKSVALISSMGPFDLKECRDDNAMRISKQPQFLRRLVGASLKNMPSVSDAAIRLLLPKCDNACLTSTKLQLLYSENLKQGNRGFLKEAELYRQPWGFALSDVRTRVVFWHGKDDPFISRQSAERIARKLPDCQTNFVNGEGHFSLIGKYFATVLKEMEHVIAV